MKQCINCKEIKSIDNFWKDRTRKDGLNNKCKTCQQKVWRESYYYKYPGLHSKRVAAQQKAHKEGKTISFKNDFPLPKVVTSC